MGECKMSDGTTERGAADRPIDKGWAWVIAFSAFGQTTAILMMVRATTLLFVEFMNLFDASPGSTAFIPGLVNFMQFGLSPVSNMISQKFGARPVVMFGGLCSTLGCLLSAFSTNVVQLYFTYGLLIGTGFGLMYSPSLVLLGQYFDRRRALANGLAGIGSAISAIVSPLLIRYLLDSYGFRTTLVAYAAIQVQVCVTGALLRPLSFYMKKFKTKVKGKHKCHEPDFTLIVSAVPNETPNTESLQKSNCSCEELSTPIDSGISSFSDEDQITSFRVRVNSLNDGKLGHCVNRPRLALTSSLAVSTGDFFATSLQECNDKNKYNSSNATMESKLQHEINFALSTKTLFHRSALKNPYFLLLLFSDFFAILGFAVMPMFLAAYCATVGISSNNTALLCSLAGISELILRPVVGWLTDFDLMPKIYFKLINCLAMGVACLIFTQFTSFVGVLSIVMFMQPTIGIHFTLIPVVLVDLLGIHSLPSTLGVNMLVVACGFFVSPVLTGFLYDVTGKWMWTFTLGGLCCFISCLFLLVIQLIKRFRHTSTS